MPSTENSPCFPINIDRNQKIWRYMDFTKFMHILTTKSLWFNSVANFDDPFEGTYPINNLQKLRGTEKSEIEYLVNFLRQFIYVNCWYISDHESAAMWNLYAQTNEAIAIQSTYEKLHSVMPSECYIGEVTYIDYKSDIIPDDELFYPYMIKRKAFSHEKELRAIIKDSELAEVEGLRNDVEYYDYTAVTDKLGLSVAVEPLEFIENICVAPMSPRWFKELVQEICISKGFGNKSIIISELDDDPY